LDGLDNNDGILLIGTTNHLDRLDNSVKNRPSRFDRKYLFDDPDESERRLYCGYWQKKLAHNSKVSFPDSLADEIAKNSDGLSFAYLKEALCVSFHIVLHLSRVVRSVSTLVLLATQDGIDFARTLKAQVKELRDQVREHPENMMNIPPETSSIPVRCEASRELAATRELLQRLSAPEIPRGLSTTAIMPSANIGLRRWI
jgi:transitional endoplasmic reticulum ATPase